MTYKPNIVALILAAGASRRMGTAKQLLPYGNKTMLAHVIATVNNSNVTKCNCVLGAHAEKIMDGLVHTKCQWLINPNWKNGLSTSIVQGITHLADKHIDGVLILLGDQPGINSENINQFIKQHLKNPESIIASNYTHGYGVPALFPERMFPLLLSLNGDKGAKTFLNNPDNDVIPYQGELNLFDIDTPEDYEQVI